MQKHEFRARQDDPAGDETLTYFHGHAICGPITMMWPHSEDRRITCVAHHDSINAPMHCFNAVVDDFGTLTRVSA